MQKNVSFVITLSLAVIFISLFAFNWKKDKADKPSSFATTGKPLSYQPPPLPDSLHFAGEQVPLHRQDIREQLDREVLYNYYLPNNILYIIKLTGRYFPLIEERLRAHGVPDDMKYLCVAESNLQQLVSRVGAAGFWQFMPGTAPAYGLEVNDLVDERYHIEKSTDAACAYLKRAYQQFGSWTAAAASYNCGMGAYRDHSRFQRSDNYYDLMLPEETNRYLFRILTFKYFITRAPQLGFMVSPEETYPVLKVKRVPVADHISSLADFAIKQGISYKTLKQYNPWLRGRSLPVKKNKTYIVYLPAGN
jgi:membrane-bound lytic murein transglycosylase D